MRIDVHRTLAVTILLVSVRGFADHDLLTPLNINTQVPLAGVSVECARFFNLGGWGDGAWGRWPATSVACNQYRQQL